MSLTQQSQSPTTSVGNGYSCSSRRRIIFPCLYQAKDQPQRDMTKTKQHSKDPSFSLDNGSTTYPTQNTVVPSAITFARVDVNAMHIPSFLSFPKQNAIHPKLQRTSSSPSAPTSILKSKSKMGTTEDLESLPSLVSITSESSSSSTSTVSFDPRILVCEFERQSEEFKATWYSGEELNLFKHQALERVNRYQGELVPTGTGRMVHTASKKSRALFTHHALTLDGEGDDDDEILHLATNELRNILVIDPHDMCLKLFHKALKRMLPSSNIILCQSSKEALRKMSENRIDMVIVEHRLKGPFSGEECGATFIRQLSKQVPDAIFVGVSAHFDIDKDALKQGGADECWPKPPPPMNQELRNSVLKKILLKRNKEDLIRLHL
mmetsp:Transcript_8967/g.13000  ORF Transcript_8967/g.13000 Transcript_8967/m.13000 type:complete len:379 (-) Transcript_8967:106-1242(-)|eukprot:CAMPEP_0202452994 /NCGR_PEP_ID=MMETSP1360-20130828/11085_1 /ASSEMBLY_ACC=CAM_ASM_000848 /TAXON_ID=515479 /ORGANISM="Licmophora paradoxa, Strain CCMP2313" /LENGTH=378 /DNA_ID=CAMNT_0049071981 /DNA_START=778 /DNA_END=1914 /DNA_ORIENTATION=-